MTYYLVINWPNRIDIEEFDTYKELEFRVEDLQEDLSYGATIKKIISGMSIKIPRTSTFVVK